MKIYIITGAPDDRKSSAIRALTGVRDTKTFDLQFENGVVRTHVMVVSCNEIKSTRFSNGITPKQLVEYLKNLKEDETAAMLPLRSVSPKFDLPIASEYIQALLEEGFELAQVAMFNRPIELPTNTQSELIVNTRLNPCNQTASALRKMWKIV